MCQPGRHLEDVRQEPRHRRPQARLHRRRRQAAPLHRLSHDARRYGVGIQGETLRTLSEHL